MKKNIVLFLALSCALLFSVKVSAQLDERAPGIYAIVGDQSIPLTYSNGSTSSSGFSVLGFEVAKKKYEYKEPTSGVNTSNTFVLVIDLEKKHIVRSMKAYDPFVKTMTPDNLLILPLSVDGNTRIYEEGKTYNGMSFEIKDRVEFEWEKITDNSFIIRIKQIIPGEYGFILRAAALGTFEYSTIYGFTYVE